MNWLICRKFPEGWDYALFLFSRGPFVKWKHQDTFKLIKGRAQFQMVSLHLRCDILNLFTHISVNALWRGFQVFLSHQCGSENLDGKLPNGQNRISYLLYTFTTRIIFGHFSSKKIFCVTKLICIHFLKKFKKYLPSLQVIAPSPSF